MFTRRDLIIVVAAFGGAWGALSFAQETPVPVPTPAQPVVPAVMGSTVFDWTKLPVKQTAKGEVRKVVQAPTATLDELECHITTLNPGQEAHAPHQHPDEELLIEKEGTVESLVNGMWTRLGPGVGHLPGLETDAQHPQCRRHACHLSRHQVELTRHAEEERSGQAQEGARGGEVSRRYR